jgi:hypothetical protein
MLAYGARKRERAPASPGGPKPCLLCKLKANRGFPRGKRNRAGGSSGAGELDVWWASPRYPNAVRPNLVRCLTCRLAPQLLCRAPSSLWRDRGRATATHGSTGLSQDPIPLRGADRFRGRLSHPAGSRSVGRWSGTGSRAFRTCNRSRAGRCCRSPSPTPGQNRNACTQGGKRVDGWPAA